MDMLLFTRWLLFSKFNDFSSFLHICYNYILYLFNYNFFDVTYRFQDVIDLRITR